MTALQIVLLVLAALLFSGAAAGLLVRRLPPGDFAIDEAPDEDERESSDEVQLPSGHRYRLTLDRLEVECEGQWQPAGQVNAEDAVALMRWYAGVDL